MTHDYKRNGTTMLFAALGYSTLPRADYLCGGEFLRRTEHAKSAAKLGVKDYLL